MGDERRRSLGRIAEAPDVAAQAIAEFRLAVAIERLLELEPADEGVSDALAGRVEAARRDEPLPLVRSGAPPARPE